MSNKMDIHFFLADKKLMKHATFPASLRKRSVVEATVIERIAFDYGVEMGIQIATMAWDKVLSDYIKQVREEEF